MLTVQGWAIMEVSDAVSTMRPGRSGMRRRVVACQAGWHLDSMTHTSTAKAKRREADRLRKRRERAERKAAGAPAPHQVDLAVAEAVSFTLAMSLPAGAERVPADATISMRQVVQAALRILVKRWGFDKAQAGKALQTRIGKRREHSSAYWYLHFPSAEPSFSRDMSAAVSARTHVTSSGQVRSNCGSEVTEM